MMTFEKFCDLMGYDTDEPDDLYNAKIDYSYMVVEDEDPEKEGEL